MYHYIYKTTLLLGTLAGHYYYGKRSKNVVPENDGYAGSGKIITDYFNKYGRTEGVSYKKEILELNPDKYTNAAREREIIETHLGEPMCLNLTKGGFGGGVKGRPSPMKGKHHNEESRKKISESNKGRVFSEETKKKISERLKGKEPWCKGKHNIFSEEMIKKLSEQRKGTHVSEETKQKLSESHKGQTPWNKGVPMSETTKKKLSQSLTGRTSGMKGKHLSEKTKQLLREKTIGKTNEANPQNIKIIAEFDGLQKEYPSIGSAARELNISSGNLAFRLRKNPDGCWIKNYFFKYKETEVA